MPMSTNRPYPEYRTYGAVGGAPSLLSQEFPRPAFQADENYYPVNKLLEPHFGSHEESRRFGAITFCGFLEDTIEVEHCLVIPAVATIRRLPWEIPPEPEQDLFKTATDEGFHAEQALRFVEDLRSHFGFAKAEEYRVPLFLRRLQDQRNAEPNAVYRDLITVLNGVVTETRISVELSKFAADKFLAPAVREICRTHADDEIIHSSQFRALGEWLWEGFDENTRGAAARFLTASTIARSLADVERIAFFMHQATMRPHLECRRLIYSVYTAEALIQDLLVETRPTVTFLDKLGVNNYLPFSEALENERKNLASELKSKTQALGG